MSKAKQLMEYTSQEIISYICQEKNVSWDFAMNEFYTSTVFEKLQDEETGLYTESPAFVYDLYKDERNAGRLVQKEI